MGEDKNLENHVEARQMGDIELDNAAVLLDVNSAKAGSIATALKLAKDGHTILVPQPSDDPNDPLNWSETKKSFILFTISIAAFIADFQAAVGAPDLLPQAVEWHMTPNKVNYAGNLNVLLVGVGGLFWLPLISIWGRAPVLFWVILTGTLFTLGAALTENFAGYYGFRALMGFTLTGGQTIGLAFIQDIYFFHQHARKIGFWTAVFLASPYCGPLFGYFIVAQTGKWRPTYWMTFGLGCVILVAILLFADETWYRRDIPREEQPERGSRIMRILGVWQIRHHKEYFMPPSQAYRRAVVLLAKPIVTPILIFYLMNFMWAIGINQTSAILFETPREKGGYGFGPLSVGYLCFTPVIGVLIGEFIGHWFNDWLANSYIRKHRGIFRPEARLTAMYPSQIIMVAGLVLIGQSLKHVLTWVALAFGWGMYVTGYMIVSVAITAYALDSYPNAPGEVSALINFSRIIGGFAVGYFQLDWGLHSGFDVSFGIQAAIVGASMVIIVVLHIWGEKIRAKGGSLKL